MSDASKAAILDAIRDGLAGARAELRSRGRSEPRYEALVSPGRPVGLDTEADRVARFRERLEAVAGRCTLVHDEAEAAAALRRIVEAKGARRLAVSDDSTVQLVSAGLDAVELWKPGGDRAELLEADLGLSTAQWGIAETGTLVLESAAERHRLVSLVPPVHVALLRASRILGTLGQALAAVRRDDPTGMSRAVTLITGPSRTADIELTLVVGVHGPKELHVLLLQDTPS